MGKKLIHFPYGRFGLGPDDMLTANMICSYDLNSMQFPHISKDFLGPFNMGSLNGFPYTGITGMTAFAHDVPNTAFY